MAKVELDAVSKIYAGGVKAVNAIDLSIRDQEFIVLVGPSGCGKSTTLRMVAGLEEISEGEIRIGDRVVNDVPPKDRDIAMVFQNYALYPHMSVYKNMAFGLKLRKMPKDQIHKRVMDAAKILDIEHLLERKPKALSGGQRQRVAVGRAIVREPAAFLFDEPLSNLDAKLRVTTRAELKRLHQRLKTTTIYVTHDQEEAMTLGDRIVVMKDGLIQQADTPLITYNSPANRFVAGFIGMPPMNFFDGALKLVNGEMVFEEGKLENAKVSGSAAKKMAKEAEVDEPVVMTGDLTLPGNGFTLAIPDRMRDRLAGKVGSHVILGVRPEHIHLERSSDTFVPLPVMTTVTEPLGKEMDVYLKTALHDHVVARVDAKHAVQQNAPATAYVDMSKCHLFEPGETGLNLTREADVSAGNEQSESSHAVA
ncbi:MAG TPA: sn-glycerol-3-phosphate ABC transporter ATP-binding protein UgpC [Tepidisphaeraceae bacterium]|jgi:multiple sugar transport system ATP-binding protein|nr:sn-glycerol-3-phosphate ABC transporter ATP-binding protein UgpC [Tepidisphaeraceae bacterium]